MVESLGSHPREESSNLSRVTTMILNLDCCPFCGNTNIHIHPFVDYDHESNCTSWRLELICYPCNLVMVADYIGTAGETYAQTFDKVKKIAVEKWSKRFHG